MLCIVERLVGHEIVLRYLMVGGGGGQGRCQGSINPDLSIAR